MFSELAKNDVKALRSAGFDPTDEEVIQLNDLALRIERGKNTTPANMPRVAFAGDVVLHEPTVGALEWWYKFGSAATASPKQRMMAYFFMLAHARDLDTLDRLESPKDVNRAVRRWMKSVNATESELWRALWYVKYGLDTPEPDGGKGAALDDDAALDQIWEIVCAVAGMMNVTPDQLRIHTQSTVMDCMERCAAKTGVTMKKSVAEDYVKYRQLLRQIEQRKGAENG